MMRPSIIFGMADPQMFVTALERAGARLTETRRTVARLVADSEGPFTANDLASSARRGRLDIGRATIFRSLELFGELGLVERLDLPSGEHAYVRCEAVHHHHLVCSACGRSTRVDDCGMAAVTREAARRTGFRIDMHRLELFGLCPDCQRARPGT